jgi:hypothetical protein
MDFLETRPSQQLFYLTVCISLLVHVIVLMLPAAQPQANKPPQRLNVRMAPNAKQSNQQAAAPATIVSPLPGQTAPRLRKPAPAPSKPALSSPAPAAAAVEQPKYTQAERDDVNNFLDSLGPTPKGQPKAQASLSKRSLAMAQNIGREMAHQPDDGPVTVERIPNSPPVDRYSLEAYLDSLMNRLNRNAKLMKHSGYGGRGTAALQVRINPDGTIQSLEVLNESDQKEQVEFVKRLLERSAPYSPFPPAMTASAKSLGIVICIKPGSSGDFGFSRFERGESSGC